MRYWAYNLEFKLYYGEKMSYFRENIEKVSGYVPGFQPGKGDVVKLNTNENPYPASGEVIAAIGGISAEQLRRYPEPLGDSFREAASEVHGVGPGNILCCNGGDDLLTICFRAFCDEGRGVAYPVPTYSLYPVLAKLQNCEAIEKEFGEDFSLPAGLGSAEAGLTIVCNPNAPSGTCVKIDEMASLAGEVEGVLLIDEAYVDFAEGDCIGLIQDFDNIIILRSMSKGYSLAGIRFGYAIADEKLISGLAKVKDSYNVNVVSLAAANAAIKDRGYFEENVAKVKAQRKRLVENLRELGFSVPDSETNFVLVKCNDCDAGEVYDKLVGRNIYVRYFNLPMLDDKLRITVGTKEQNNVLIEALKEITG